MHNASFWRRHFQSVFRPHLERTVKVLEHRLLPTFDGIEAEATALREKTYNELVSMPLDPDVVDESMLAESAFEAGYAHYSGMEAVRQSLVNSLAPIPLPRGSSSCWPSTARKFCTPRRAQQ